MALAEEVGRRREGLRGLDDFALETEVLRFSDRFALDPFVTRNIVQSQLGVEPPLDPQAELRARRHTARELADLGAEYRRRYSKAQ